MRFVPESVHRELVAIAERHRLPTAPGIVAKALVELSRDYNERGATHGRPELLAARLFFSVVRDVPKSALALRELVATNSLPTRTPLRVLDLGAGLGATTLGLATALGRAGRAGAIDAHLVDVDGDALALARELAAHFPTDGAELRVRADRAALPLEPGAVPLDRERYDVILLGQVLSELDRDLEEVSRADKHAAWIERLLEGALAPDGALVVVEPALRDRTRHLHRVRARLAKRVFAPCLHHDDCPMLTRDGDWCHEDAAIDLPTFAEPLARAAGLRWQGLTFSYLVLRRDGRTLAGALGGPELRRIVESPRITKGKREFALCSGPSLVRATRLDRDAQKGDVLECARRGDVLRLPLAPDAAGRARIGRAEGAAASLPVDALTREP